MLDTITISFKSDSTKIVIVLNFSVLPSYALIMEGTTEKVNRIYPLLLRLLVRQAQKTSSFS